MKGMELFSTFSFDEEDYNRSVAIDELKGLPLRIMLTEKWYLYRSDESVSRYESIYACIHDPSVKAMRGREGNIYWIPDGIESDKDGYLNGYSQLPISDRVVHNLTF